MEIDINKVTASVVTDLTKSTVKSILSYFPAKIRGKYDVYFRNFEEYLERTHKSCSIVRTIISKDKPTGINEIYVKAKFKCGKEFIGDDELCQRIRDGQRVVVCGFGGIGKTIFCKYFWKSLYDNPIGKIPIYFELRNINEITTQDLPNYIRLSLTIGDKPLPEDAFAEMMANGRFVFIFDGFDEVPEKFRLDIQAQIIDLSDRYPECAFVVSSRADDRFSSWLQFHTYNAVEFNKDQSRAVITKVDFDKDIKKEFLVEILEKRYDDYKNFFSTPLLTLMMLMTYLQIRYVPDSRHVFYRYAFQTLYTLHDASKQGFQRKRFVEMSESDFINVFSLFCLVSYADMEHSFSKGEIIKYLEKVKIRARVEYDSVDFLKECVESVNLIYKDGDQYSFLHRSFQEYFCAYAATHYFPDRMFEVLEKIPVRRSDSVFSMMYSINPDVLSKMYIIPTYRSLQKEINSIAREVDTIKILESFDIKLDILFSAERKNSAFGYMINYENRIKRFSETVVSMFKSELPKDMLKEFNGYAHMKSLMQSIKSLVPRINDRGSVLHYRSTFNFSIKKLTIVSTERGLEPDKIIEFDFSDIDKRILNNSYLIHMSQSMKAELVFAKRKCDEIARRYREVEKRGDDILSL